MSARVHVVGYLSIDRIEHGGRSVDGVPGGAALYGALAANAAGAPVKLYAIAGDDFRDEWLAQLAERGIDISAMRRADGPTRRARLAYGAGDRRMSAHHGEAEWWRRTHALAPPPPSPDAGDIVALMAVPGDAADASIAAARSASARVAMDTSAAFADREPAAILARAAAVFAFAPSAEETRVLYPGLDDDTAALRLAATGCNILHKRGPAGAFAVRAGAGSGLRLPAPPVVEPRDPTGAGDATVGALAAALAGGAEFVAAAGAALEFGARCVRGLGPAAFGFDYEGMSAP